MENWRMNMFTIEKTIVINRPQKDVFDFASNPANTHKWQSVVKSKKWISEEPHGVGSTQRFVSRFMGLNLKGTNEYTVWDPPNQYSFKTIDSPLPIEEGMRFESEGNSTKVTWRMQVEAGGVFKLLEGLLKKQAENQPETDLKALKFILEEGSV
jgi:carbon monoxide dehydrogenase subunit G